MSARIRIPRRRELARTHAFLPCLLGVVEGEVVNLSESVGVLEVRSQMWDVVSLGLDRVLPAKRRGTDQQAAVARWSPSSKPGSAPNLLPSVNESLLGQPGHGLRLREPGEGHEDDIGRVDLEVAAVLLRAVEVRLSWTLGIYVNNHRLRQTAFWMSSGSSSPHAPR